MPKITALPATSAAVLTDLLAKVNDPGGAPVTQKVTVQQLWDLLNLDAILRSSTGGIGDSVDAANRILFDSSGFQPVQWNIRVLRDTTGVPSLLWGTRQLINAAGVTTLDWNNPVGQMLHGSGPPTNSPATPAPTVLTAPAIYYDSDSGSPSYGVMWPWDVTLGDWIGA